MRRFLSTSKLCQLPNLKEVLNGQYFSSDAKLRRCVNSDVNLTRLVFMDRKKNAKNVCTNYTEK